MVGMIKDLLITCLFGIGLGEGLIHGAAFLNLPIPPRTDQRPIFLIGSMLFALVFRLMMTLREENE